MICGRNNNSVDKKNAFTFFGKKNNKNNKNAVVVNKNNDISSPSSSSSSLSSSSSKSSTDNNEQQQEHQQQHQPQQLLLSPLSKMMSKFVVDSARKTHDSIEDEDEKKDFLVNLKEAMHNSPEYRSDVNVNVNHEQRSNRRSSIDSQQQDQGDDDSHKKIKMMINRRSSAGVINFLVDTTQSTISFIETEEERNEFCKQLRSKFQDAFKSNPVVIESAE